SLVSRSTEFTPAKPIYCRRGLYVTNITVEAEGALIQWRELKHEGGD
ncbi:unnamed protein product, partial [marine sediment metagenome]